VDVDVDVDVGVGGWVRVYEVMQYRLYMCVGVCLRDWYCRTLTDTSRAHARARVRVAANVNVMFNHGQLFSSSS
jgi:hypothetical protein